MIMILWVKHATRAGTFKLVAFMVASLYQVPTLLLIQNKTFIRHCLQGVSARAQMHLHTFDNPYGICIVKRSIDFGIEILV